MNNNINTKSTLLNNLPMISQNNNIKDEDSMIKNVLNEIENEENNNTPPDMEEQYKQLQQQIEMKQRQLMYEQQLLQERQERQQEQQKMAETNEYMVDNVDKENIPLQVSISIMKELESTLYVIIIFFIVSIIPVEKLVYKYVALNKIPYSNIIIKSLLAGIIFFIMTKI